MLGRVLALFGPTAVGKTEIAIALADRLRERGERPVAVSADALQVYAGLEILTGVPDRAQRARLPHRLISFVPLDARFSVAEYAGLAHAEIDGLLAEHRRPIVVGGTGLYLQAALTDLELRPPVPPHIRAARNRQLQERGPAALHAELAERAPAAAAAIRTTDSQRVVRALELLDAGHAPQPAGDESRLWTAGTRHPTLLAGLVMDRDRLYERIDARVEAMVAAGAAEEVRAADAAGASPTARQAVGFGELLDGDVAAMQQRTRRYAKRQLTWMRRLSGVRVLDLTRRSPEDVAAELAGEA
jgi:tRNA dimethylallyltransferase